jgi:hypothetical protein
MPSSTRKSNRPFGRQKRSYNFQQEFDVTGFTADRIVSRKLSHSYSITERSVKIRSRSRERSPTQTQQTGRMYSYLIGKEKQPDDGEI